MKVAMVSEHASPLATLGGVDAGGQNVHVAELAAAMARRGVEITVYTRRDDPGLPKRVPFAPRVTVEHVDAGPARAIPKDELLPHMGAFAEHLDRSWRRERPDVAHAHFWMSGLAAQRAARPLAIPVALTFHALGVVKKRHQGSKDTSPRERLRIENELVRTADHIVATSSDEVFELARLGADPGRATVVPCGVNLDLFHPDGPAEARREGVHRLVVVSRLVERKGIGNVISALGGVPDAELIIAGGGSADELASDPEAERLSDLARRLRVEDRVELRGRIDREAVPALLRSADVVVCAPWYEPFGMVAVEAMACGVPVVASAVGGLIDTVVDGVTGIHVPPRDPAALEGAIRLLLGDPRLRRSLGEAGAERARSRYGWDRVAHSTLEIYRSMITARPTPVPEGDALVFGREHLSALRRALGAMEEDLQRIDAWGRHLAGVLTRGGRLLAAGNGGSAAQAQHLTAELVGRFTGDREPFSAIPLHTDTSSLTAIANDYGAEQAFARQVRAHGRPGDVLVVLSTSGRSPNVLAAVEAARQAEMTTWAITGPSPNPLAEACDDAISLDADTATAQEAHLVALHLLCAAVEMAVRGGESVSVLGSVRS